TVLRSVPALLGTRRYRPVGIERGPKKNPVFHQEVSILRRPRKDVSRSVGTGPHAVEHSLATIRLLARASNLPTGWYPLFDKKHAHLPNRPLRYSLKCFALSPITRGSCLAFARMIAPWTTARRCSARLWVSQRAPAAYLALASSRSRLKTAACSARQAAQTARMAGWVSDSS